MEIAEDEAAELREAGIIEESGWGQANKPGEDGVRYLPAIHFYQERALDNYGEKGLDFMLACLESLRRSKQK